MPDHMRAPDPLIGPNEEAEAERYWQSLTREEQSRLMRDVPGWARLPHRQLMQIVYRKMKSRRASLDGGDVVVSVGGRPVVRLAAADFGAGDPELFRQLVQEKLDARGEEFLRAAIIHQLRRRDGSP